MGKTTLKFPIIITILFLIVYILLLLLDQPRIELVIYTFQTIRFALSFMHMIIAHGCAITSWYAIAYLFSQFHINCTPSHP
jgi:hypothetical protein